MIRIFTTVDYGHPHYFYKDISMDHLPIGGEMLELKVGDEYWWFLVSKEARRQRWSEKTNLWVIYLDLPDDKKRTSSDDYHKFVKSWQRAMPDGIPTVFY